MTVRVGFDELKGKTLGVAMEINLLEQDLNKVDTDLYYLNKLHKDLLYNVNLLKKEDVISIISEYQRSTEALEMIKKQIVQARHFKKQIVEKFNRKNKEYKSCYDQLKSRIDGSNVLPFKRKIDDM